MDEFIEFCRHLARGSGELIRPHFRMDGIEIETKKDLTIVTRTDREAESWMRAEIETAYPSHGIIGEEFGNVREDAEYVWILDPIDGTISFAAGVPLFGTLIGLMHKRRPVVGCIYQPVLDILCIGDNKVTTVNDSAARVGSCKTLSEAALLTTDPGLVEHHQDYPAFESVRREVSTFRTWGDCFGYLQLVTGRADAMLDPVLNPWDLLPLIPVVRGAGGKITSWEGKNPVLGSSCIASVPGIHQELVTRLNPSHKD